MEAQIIREPETVTDSAQKEFEQLELNSPSPETFPVMGEEEEEQGVEVVETGEGEEWHNPTEESMSEEAFSPEAKQYREGGEEEEDKEEPADEYEMDPPPDSRLSDKKQHLTIDEFETIK